MGSDLVSMTQPPVAATGMLIRRPVAEVFEAFVDVESMTKFWFTDGSGSLVSGSRVTWTWSMYGFSTEVDVIAVDPDRRILLDWHTSESPSRIEWTFEPLTDRSTFVESFHSGFRGTGDAVVQQAVDSAGGFSFVLAGAKSWLEHGIQLELVRDRHPKGLG